RQRVHRGDRRSVCQRAHRDRSRTLSRHHRGERDRPHPGVGRNPRQFAEGGMTTSALPKRSQSMERFVSLQRSVMNHFITGLSVLSTVLVLVPLVAILGYLLYKGASSLNLAFFTKVPAPVGETGGGMANSIVGSGLILAVASAMGIPLGIAGGVYLAEYGR